MASLLDIFSKTNLDLENASVLGGPSKAANDPTVYPALNSGVPTVTQNPTDNAKPFNQNYTPTKTYLESVNYRDRVIKDSPLSGNPENPQILDITNLDNSKPGVTPYKPLNDPTLYPVETTGRSAIKAWSDTIQGAPSVGAQKFDPKYNSSKKYQENIEIDLGIAPNAAEPTGPKIPQANNAAVKFIKKTNSVIQSIGSLFGGTSK
jgi:hypothetical protein